MKVILLMVAIVLAAGGCEPREKRPSRATWVSAWENIRRELPSGLELGNEADPKPSCSRGLSALRERQGELLPSFRPELDPLVRTWIDRALEMYYDCPPGHGFEAAQGRLETLEGEIQAAMTPEP